MASLALDATYWADVVFDRIVIEKVNGCLKRDLIVQVLILHAFELLWELITNM